MAPVTRRSAAAAAVSKPITRKVRPQRQQSDGWEFLDRQQSDMSLHDDEQEQRRILEAPPQDTQMAVDSLRDIADRVGKEVESFAETLDRFLDDLPTQDNVYDAAHDLVLQFKGIAEDAVEELKKSHEREMRDQLRKEWASQAGISALAQSQQVGKPFARSEESAGPRTKRMVEQLRQYQEEADTWELFRVVLELHYNRNEAALAKEKEEALARLGSVHRYTPESELYDRFLIENDLARERSLVKTWLEQTAEHQQSDLPEIMEELENRVGAGSGLWSRGWMNTREKIKGEKRLRTWPQPDSSPLPQIRRSDNELVVTSLDPDAPMRQERLLEKQDGFYDRALWIACWTMLRRGVPWSEICDWCEERKEGWRALVMGKGMTSSDTGSNMAWRKMCFLASRSEAVGDYEAAVYGLLGGNVQAVNNISRSVDDRLYAHYNAQLIQQFDQYLQGKYPHRIPAALGKSGSVNAGVVNAVHAQGEVQDLIYVLRTKKDTRREATFPTKIVQSYLLANQTDDFVNTLGTAIREVTPKELPGKAVEENVDDRIQRCEYPEACILTDPTGLRIAAHIGLVLQVARTGPLDADDRDVEDDVFHAYIKALRAQGRRDLVPLYASRLSEQRQHIALARVMEDVTSSREMDEMISLMEQKEMNLDAVLFELHTWTLQGLLDAQPNSKGISILETTDDQIFPGQKIRSRALPEQISQDEEALVRALQWYQQLNGQWEATFRALTLALRKALFTGRFALARAIINAFPYDIVSKRKSYQILSLTVNIATDDESRPANDDQTNALWDLMQQQSHAYYQLEQLVLAFESLTAYRAKEATYMSQAPRLSSPPQPLKQSLQAVSAAMAPLIETPFLLKATDEDEADDLETIRTSYLPEAIIAYNTVLHSGAFVVTRDCLLQAMDLSVAVAREEGRLTDAFVDGKRMGELVEGFARGAKSMLVLKGVSHKPWKVKRDRLGRDPGVWEIGGLGVGEEE